MDNLYSYEIIGQNIKNAKYYFPYNEIIVTKALTKNEETPIFKYEYYIFVKEYNENINDYVYYILLSCTKFNKFCRKIRYDDYDRMRLNVPSDIRPYIESLKEFNIRYEDCTNDYDKYVID